MKNNHDLNSNSNSYTRMARFFAAVFMALALAACASTNQEAGTGEIFDDTVVTTKVKAAFVQDPVVSALSVNVETFKGVVQLSGFVKTAAERNQAVEVARKVQGVKEVKNDILIR